MTEKISRRNVLAASLAAAATPAVWAQAPAPDANPFGLKLMITGRRKPGTTLAEHRQHIRQVHGELVLAYIAADPANAPRRYAQNAVFDGSYRSTTPGTDPFSLNRDFVTEVWFPDFAALQRSVKTPFYLQKLKGDEDNFVDQPNVVATPMREREVLARGPTPASGCKLFVMVQRAPGVDAAAFTAAWTQTAASFNALTAAARVTRYVQNEPAVPPGVPTLLAGIDEFWLEDEADAQALQGQFQAWIRTALVAKGLVADTGYSVLLAREQLLYAGAR